MRGIGPSSPSGQPSTQASNPVDDMVTPSASFHATENGKTSSSSQARNLPQNETQEEIEQVFKRLLEDATISLHDFTKARLDEYVAGPEFGQKGIDLVDRVIPDYLVHANVAENLFMRILRQPSAENLLDTRSKERIRTYL